MTSVPDIGNWADANGVRTNYHDLGSGTPIVFLHGSGPGVSAWSNWRLVLPALSDSFRVIAPDNVGFGYTETPADASYTLESWLAHICDFLDALGLARVHLVGNSFGGALAIALTITVPERVDRLVLMGSAGVRFDLTEGLDAVWGYQPSLENMRKLLDIFSESRELVTDDLARLRYQASIRPGVQEAYSRMFPAPRQRWVDALAAHESRISDISHETLIVHGREDQVIPMDASLRLHRLIKNSQLHVFGRCGHWAQIEHNHRFVALLSGFFNEPDSLGSG